MKFMRFWFPVLLYSGIIFCISSMPDLVAPLSKWHLDKVFHLAEYTVFGLLLARALGQRPHRLLMVFILSLLYGLSDEIHQTFVPGRTFGWLDIMADAFGGVLGGMIYQKRLEKLNQTTEN